MITNHVIVFALFVSLWVNGNITEKIHTLFVSKIHEIVTKLSFKKGYSWRCIFWSNSLCMFSGVGATCPGADRRQWGPNVPWLRGAHAVPGATTATVGAAGLHRRTPVPGQVSLCPHHIHWPRAARWDRLAYLWHLQTSLYWFNSFPLNKILTISKLYFGQS